MTAMSHEVRSFAPRLLNTVITNHSLAVVVVGLLVGVLNYYHVSLLYENDRFFSHLSHLEREMCFRSEMGLYYSFFKRIVSSSSLRNGILNLIQDNSTEFPKTINSLTKFNIYPEIMSAGAFKLYEQCLNAFNSTGRNCFYIQRGDGMSSVESCIGLGEPIFFYLEIVWMFAGLTAFLLVCFGTLLSGTIIGGVITAISYFANHAECTRVQWTPPLRESFGYPMVLLHYLMVSAVLKENCRHRVCWKEFLISFSTLFSLLFWQFPIFILAGEIAILVSMYDVGIIKRQVFLKILTWISVGYFAALVGLVGNQLLLFSYLSAILLSAWALLIYDHNIPQLTLSGGSFVRMLFTLISVLTLKHSFPKTGNDSHILQIFLSKIFESLKDFHTLMYTCAPEFQGLPWSYPMTLTKSLLLPLFAFVIFMLAYSVTTKSSYSKRTSSKGTVNNRTLQTCPTGHVISALDPAIVFNVCLLIGFLGLSLMAMRLKLFLTPQMCVLVSLIASRPVLKSIPIIKGTPTFQYSFLVALLAFLCFTGNNNIRKQHSIQGEFSNYPLEDLLIWVQKESNTNDVFAGPMPIMAAVLLSTGRPIVNHPYYEDQEMRMRTVLAYSVFSRKTPAEAFQAIKTLGANYVILDANKCFDQRQSRGGCKMTDLWDIEDPKNAGRPALCPELYSGIAAPFKRVFQNTDFVVLSVS